MRADSKGKFFIARVRKASLYAPRCPGTGEAAQRVMLVQLDWRALECESAFF
jgi:hypothetical protein